MKKTVEERVKSKLFKIGRKNAFLRVLVIPILIITIVFLNLIKYFISNSKRFAMVAMTFFLFATYSSFSFPVFMHDELENGAIGDLNLSEESDAISFAKETEVILEDIERLDDDDVDEYADTEFQCTDDIDKFTLDEIIESNDSLANLGGNKSSSKAEEEKEEIMFSRDDWKIVLINKQHPVPEDYEFTLGTIKGNMRCDDRIIEELVAMLYGAKEEGVNLEICSPYRDLARQEMLFNNKITRYMKKGMSYMDAYKVAGQAVTVPGASEHQIGLAIDIVSDTYSVLETGFGETEAGKWLAANCAEYGFILRYPEGKEYITGIGYEPWHFRYVGKDAATVIMDAGITLEEFWEDL